RRQEDQRNAGQNGEEDADAAEDEGNGIAREDAAHQPEQHQQRPESVFHHEPVLSLAEEKSPRTSPIAVPTMRFTAASPSSEKAMGMQALIIQRSIMPP